MFDDRVMKSCSHHGKSWVGDPPTDFPCSYDSESCVITLWYSEENSDYCRGYVDGRNSGMIRAMEMARVKIAKEVEEMSSLANHRWSQVWGGSGIFSAIACKIREPWEDDNAEIP